MGDDEMKQGPILWPGAPRSPQRTWDENDGAKPLRTLFARGARYGSRESSPNSSKSIRRHRFRPMYAGANMGHPSRTLEAVNQPNLFASLQALREWNVPSVMGDFDISTGLDKN